MSVLNVTVVRGFDLVNKVCFNRLQKNPTRLSSFQ